MATRRLVEKVEVAAERDEPAAYLADRCAVVPAEVGNRLEVGRELAREPHQLDVASALALQSTRRLHLVEIAVEVDLEHRRRMIARPPRRLRLDIEAQLPQREGIDESIHHPHRIFGVDRLVQTLGKERRLIAISPLDEPLHAGPRLQLRNHSMLRASILQHGEFSHGLIQKRHHGELS